MSLRQFLLASCAAVALATSASRRRPRSARSRQRRSRSTATTSAATVTGPNGPEAGVWVIAETTDLPTRYIKSVVTDDRGRFLIPDLPQANYDVWVRGYGLVNSAKVRSAPGRIVDFTATPAPTPKAAAEIYPAIYWYSMLKVPEKREFPVGNVHEPGRVAQRGQDQRLLRLPRARQQGDAHDPGHVLRHEAGGCLGAAHPVRPGDEQHGDLDRPHRHAARDQALRRLDRPRRGRRTAGREAAAAAGPGAQRRHHAVGFFRSQALPA